MIRPEDFGIQISSSPDGATVRVTHIPTGNIRHANNVSEGEVGATRDRLIVELRSLLFDPDDIRCATGSSDCGDFIRVVHLPTGIERSALRRESSHEQLLDEVLTELHSQNGWTLAISNLPPTKIVAYYDEGHLTKKEALLRLVSAIDPSNVSNVLDALPSHWRDDLRAETESAPTDDWSGFRIVTPGAYVNVTAEQLEETERKKIAAYRSGIATLRTFFGSSDSK